MRCRSSRKSARPMPTAAMDRPPPTAATPPPAWAQQYNAQMQRAWARKFEPPSVTGGESQGVIRILMDVYRQTGDRKYLEPIPRALDYLQKSEVSAERLARFYELKTNRPL